MSKVLGITAIVTLERGDIKYALGVRSDEFRNLDQFMHAVETLCACLDYSAYQLANNRPIDKIGIPYYLEPPKA